MMTNTCIYVYNLTKNVSEKHLKEIFTCFGVLKEVNLLVEREENRREEKIKEFLKGRYAKLEFETKEDAENAMKYMNGGQIDGKMISIKYEKDLNESEQEKQGKDKRRSLSKTKSDKRKNSLSHTSNQRDSSNSMLSSKKDSSNSSEKCRKRRKKR